MISINICAARVLRDKLGFGIYNVHTGLIRRTPALAALLKNHDVHVDPEEVLEGFCKAAPRAGRTAFWFPRQPYSSLPVLCRDQQLSPAHTSASVLKPTPPGHLNS